LVPFGHSMSPVHYVISVTLSAICFCLFMVYLVYTEWATKQKMRRSKVVGVIVTNGATTADFDGEITKAAADVVMAQNVVVDVSASNAETSDEHHEVLRSLSLHSSQASSWRFSATSNNNNSSSSSSRGTNSSSTSDHSDRSSDDEIDDCSFSSFSSSDSSDDSHVIATNHEAKQHEVVRDDYDDAIWIAILQEGGE
jgi:hypothetical protein